MAKESTQTDPGLGPGSSKKGTDPGLGSTSPPVVAPPRDPSRDVSVDTLLTGLLGPDAEPKLIKRSSGEQAIAFAAPAHAVPAAHTDPSAEPAVVLRQSLVDDAEVIGVPAPAVEVWVPGGGTPKNGTRRLTPAAGVVKPAAGARPSAEPASQPKQRVAAPLAFERPGLDEKAAPKRSTTPAAGGLFLGAAVAPGAGPAIAEPHVNLTPTAPPTGSLEMSPETVRSSKPRLDPDASGKATIVTRQKPADRRGWLILGLLLLVGAILSGYLILRERPGSGTEPASTLGSAPPTTNAARPDIPPPTAVNIVADPPATSVQVTPTARPSGRRPAPSASASAPTAPATVAVVPPQPAPTASAVAPQPALTSAKGSSGDPAPPPAGFNDLKGEIRK